MFRNRKTRSTLVFSAKAVTDAFAQKYCCRRLLEISLVFFTKAVKGAFARKYCSCRLLKISLLKLN